MSFTLPIVGIIGLIGYQLNKNQPQHAEYSSRTSVSNNEIPSGSNVMQSRHTEQVKVEEQARADKRYADSKDPKRTNIIPPFYNSVCKSDTCDPPRLFQNSILPSVKDKVKEIPKTREDAIFKGPMFAGPLNAVTPNLSVAKQSSTSSGFKFITQAQMESKENFTSNLTGKPLVKSHSNMVPFFGSKMTQDTKPQSGLAVQRLERFTGNLDTPQRKKEVPPMFELKKENIYGSRPLTQQLDMDRFYQSDKQNNVLPFAQVKVQPLPETAIRPRFKTVDQLRTTNNPKVSYQGRLKPAAGVNGNYNRGLVGEVNKNQPDRFYLNEPSRYLAPTSNTKASYTQENFSTMKVPSKSQTSEIAVNLGGMYTSDSQAGSIPWSREQSGGNASTNAFTTIASNDSRNTFKADWVRNAGHSQHKPNEIEKTSHIAYEQERESANRMEIANPKYYQTAEYVPFFDQARTTHKESNLYEYLGTPHNEVNKEMDYTGAYNYTRERHAITTQDYTGAPSAQVSNTDRRDGFSNSVENIITSREDTVNRKDYAPNTTHNNLPAGKEYVNIYQRDDSLRKAKYPYGANVNRINSSAIPSENIIGMVTDDRKENIEYDLTSRIDPVLLNAHRKNPYTQSLSSV
ncbi:hypothetical protein CCP3SC1AL1_1100005 [Gammaproteobacteria bacterium]